MAWIVSHEETIGVLRMKWFPQIVFQIGVNYTANVNCNLQGNYNVE